MNEQQIEDSVDEQQIDDMKYMDKRMERDGDGSWVDDVMSNGSSLYPYVDDYGCIDEQCWVDRWID